MSTTATTSQGNRGRKDAAIQAARHAGVWALDTSTRVSASMTVMLTVQELERVTGIVDEFYRLGCPVTDEPATGSTRPAKGGRSRKDAAILAARRSGVWAQNSPAGNGVDSIVLLDMSELERVSEIVAAYYAYVSQGAGRVAR